MDNENIDLIFNGKSYKSAMSAISLIKILEYTFEYVDSHFSIAAIVSESGVIFFGLLQGSHNETSFRDKFVIHEEEKCIAIVCHRCDSLPVEGFNDLILSMERYFEK